MIGDVVVEFVVGNTVELVEGSNVVFVEGTKVELIEEGSVDNIVRDALGVIVGEAVGESVTHKPHAFIQLESIYSGLATHSLGSCFAHSSQLLSLS